MKAKDWKEAKLKYKRSQKLAPFCPYCGGELDDLRLINSSDSCGCGTWTIGGDHNTYYAKFEAQSDIPR